MESSTVQPMRPGVPREDLPRLRLIRGGDSDEVLAALVEAGSKDAFETLHRKYRPRLLPFCRRRLRSDPDAEDVVQEVFAAAYKGIQAGHRPHDVQAWLFTIARNHCSNFKRGAPKPDFNGNVVHLVPEEAGENQSADGGGSAADRVLRSEEIRLLVEELHRLPETQRTALVLYELLGRSYGEIADEMKTTVPGVKALLNRARESLGQAVEARDLSCADARLQLSEAGGRLGRCPALVAAHVKRCSACQEHKSRSRNPIAAFKAITPLAPLVALKSLLGKLGPAAAGGAASGGEGAVAGATGAAIATKAAVGLITLATLSTGAAQIAGGVGDGADRGDRPAARSAGAPSVPTTADGGSAADAIDLPSPGAGAGDTPSGAGHASPPPPAGEITSSKPDVVPGVTDTKPASKPPPLEQGTSERGRPAPGLPTERRTRPVPPGSLGSFGLQPLPPSSAPAPRTDVPPAPPAPETAQPDSGVAPPPADPAPETPPQP